jgi:hypothetical protein
LANASAVDRRAEDGLARGGRTMAATVIAQVLAA